MRWLLGGLVLANIGLLMWGSWYKDSSLPELAVAQPPVAPETMRHTKEEGVKLKSRKPSAPTSRLKAVQHVCYAVGPFTSTRLASGGGKQLKKLGLVYRLRTQETESKIYRVYLPPMATRAEALAVQRRLRKLGYKDNTILREKAMVNAISIGVYSVRQNARNVSAKLKKRGFKVRTQTIDRVIQRHWLDIDTAEVAIETLQGVRWGKGVKVEQAPCTAAGGSR